MLISMHQLWILPFSENRILGRGKGQNSQKTQNKVWLLIAHSVIYGISWKRKRFIALWMNKKLSILCFLPKVQR